MQLRLIMGRPGAGKTSRVISEMRKKELGSRGIRQLLIVPEQAAVQTERLLLRDKPAISGIEALSFKRLAVSVLQETGPSAGELTASGKYILLRKVLFDLKGKLRYFAASLAKEGFIPELAECLDIFAKYRLDPDTLRELASKLGDNSAIGLKLLDLAMIEESRAEYMRSNSLPDKELLDILAERAGESEQVKEAYIYIDGFNSFTPQEMHVIKALMRSCRELTVTLSLDEDRALSELFHKITHTEQKLIAVCEDEGIGFRREIAEGVTGNKPGDIGLLAESFHNSRAVFKSVGGISAAFAGDMRSELVYCAKKISGLVRGGLRYGEIGVLLCDAESYADELRSVFDDFGIVYHLDEKYELKDHRAVRLISGLLRVVSENWSYDAVFTALKTGLCGISRDDCDFLENFVLERGINGGLWNAEWFEWTEDADSSAAERLNGIRKRVVKALEPLCKGLYYLGTYKAGKITEKLYDCLLKLELGGSLEKSSAALLKAGEKRLAALESQIWEKICGTLEAMGDMLGGEELSVGRYLQILCTGFSAVRLGAIPSTLDMVVCGDFHRSILPKKKVLFVPGLNEGVFPAGLEKDGLLSRRDRERLMELGVEQPSFGIRRVYEDMFLFYSAMGRAEQSIHLSCRTSDERGTVMRESQIMADIAKRFPGMERIDIAKELAAAPPDVMNEAFSLLCASIREGKEPDSELDGILNGDPVYAGRISALKLSLARNTGGERLSPESAELLYGGVLKTNVTRLEGYYSCPFSHFAKYGLRAAERRVHGISNLDIGNCYHAIFEAYAANVTALGGVSALKGLSPAELSRVAAESADAAMLAYDGDSMPPGAQNAYFRRRIRDAAVSSINTLSSHLRSGSFELGYSEAAFLERPELADPNERGAVFEAPSYELENGRRMTIEGRIDRVDLLRLDDAEYVKVIDYKSGRRDFDVLEVYHGLRLQLLIYMRIFMAKHHPKDAPDMETRPAAALYFTAGNPILDGEKTGAEGSEPQMLEEFRMNGGIVNARPEVVLGLDSSLGEGNTRSSVVPIKLTKQKPGEDMSFYKGQSKHLSESDFNALLAFSERKAAQAAEGILSGDISIRPYKLGSDKACKFCAYSSVCGFDPARNPGGYNYLEKMDKEQVMDRLRSV